MKKIVLITTVTACFFLTLQPHWVQARQSSLNNFQFDGVTSDDALKAANVTREKWLELYPRQAREYWDAWDCKDKSCDSQWKANIRAKAKIIPRPKGKSASKSASETAKPKL